MWPVKEKQRRILSGEKGAIVKDWGGKTSIALVYPNTYDIGMSNLAVHTIYKLFNDHKNIVCERAFLPNSREIAEHQRTKTPILSIETQRPLSDFDIIAFSISFQNDFLNIIPILSLCSIPHRKSERTKDHPMLIAGGCAVTINPRPVTEIFDFIFLGEVEDEIEEIAAKIPSLCKGGSGRVDREISAFSTLSDSPLQRGRRFVTEDLDDWPTQTVIYTPHTEFGNMHLIETGRGCPRKCKFCVTPHLYEPLRIRSFDALLKMVKSGLPNRKRFGLIGSDLLSHKAFFEIVNAIHELGATFSPSSLCVDEIDDEVAKLLAKSGHKSISLGVEAASDHLRTSIGKKFPSERILEAAESLARHGICSVRLYFMIGLPGETGDDINAIAELSKKIQSAIHKAAPKSVRSTKVTLTITPFVPKPMTTFEDAEFAGEDYLKGAIKTLKKLLGKTSGIEIHAEQIVSSMCDAILSKGDEKLIGFLEKCFETNPRTAIERLLQNNM